ncbi:hypothetical protein QFC19_001543 [Naganishia cerealis]|uniref:Uncharacterized protein n=1 Tax=Naganishia cerealis TaxID=610337 RepID=A0ACC2WG88_9TREE|nr:hypothetical protein QFC19_001543 [Naganishia cerealis]
MPCLARSCTRTYTAASRSLHTASALQNVHHQPQQPAPIPAADALAAVAGSPTPVSGALTQEPGSAAQGHEKGEGRRMTLADEMGRREREEWKVNLRRVREWRREQGKLRSTFSSVQPPSSTPSSTSPSLLSTLLASGAELGHSTSRLCPPFTPYIYGHRAGLHIIDLESSTVPLLQKAAKVVKEVVKADGVVLIVGTRAEHRTVVRKAVERLEGNGFGVAGTSWMAGTLTNSVSYFGPRPIQQKSNIPDLVIILNPSENLGLIRECTTMKVPTVGIVDTDTDPRVVTYAIPANMEQWVQKVADLETSTTHPSPFLTQAVEAPGVTRASSSSEGPSVPTDTPPSPPPAESAQPSNLGGQQESKVKPHTVDNTALPPQTSGGTRQSKAVPSPSKAAKADPSPSKAAPAVPSASQSADKGNKASPKVGKAGLGWNAESGTEWKQFLDIPGNQIGWTYNWDSKRLSDGLYPAGLNFVPMLHGDKANHPADFEVNKKNFKDWGVTHVMSFNEPDIPTGGAGGSGMSTPDAVKMHQKYFTSELNKDFKIVAPAYSGLAGFVEWEKACNKQCLYDVIPLHYYGKTLDGLTKLLDEAEKKFPGKPIWVTEVSSEAARPPSSLTRAPL